MFIIYMLSVLIFFIVVSSLLAVTRFGARGEIQARGFLEVGIITHKIADGTATIREKVMVVLMTAFGAFISPLWVVTSALVGGILYLVFEVWF
jgi:hypothetical protein